ncbi:MAG: cell division protein ZapB [Deltaproteobacteria bacterium]|nr:cell division protein ZapB [Deltaproteobacteria bacterium]
MAYSFQIQSSSKLEGAAKGYEITAKKGKSETVELSKFNELEEKIKGIIEENTALRKKNRDLEGVLNSKEGELEEIKNKIGILSEERDSVRAKVDSLLDMLQNIPD